MTDDGLTKFRLDLLAAIARRTRDGADGPKGLAVREAVADHYGVDPEGIRHSRLYQNLDALVEAGLVTKGSIDGRTNTYGLSPRGRRELEANAEWYATAPDGAEVSVRVN